MKIRFVHQYFFPDLSSVSQVISQIAFDLAAQGDQVSVICSKNKYDRTQSGGPLIDREVVRGVEIWRCWGPSIGRQKLLGSLLDMASFCLLAALRSLIVPRADTIVLLTNPPLFSLLGVLAKWLRKERFVYVLMDMYPNIAVQAGILRKGSIAELFSRRISRMTLESADQVVVLGEDMRDVAIREGAAPEKVVIIQNWADPEMIYPVSPEENPLRREWGLGEKFVVEYSGNLGISHFFEDILSIAAELVVYDDLRFVFIGGGKRFKEVEHFVRDRHLGNVLLFPYRDKSDLAQSLSVGDVHFVSLRPGYEGLVVPSKAYGIMAAGRPMIYQGNPAGEIARMVSREGIGYVVQPGDRNGLKEAILNLYKDKEERYRMGRVARAVLERRYSPGTGLRLYRMVLSGTP